MFIVPRTPISPRRLSPINMSVITNSNASSVSISPTPSLEMDVYDKFSNIYFSCDIKVRSILLKTVIEFVQHPTYTHLLKTMDNENAHHVMGYLRSQHSVEMYYILDQISKNPLPSRSSFIKVRVDNKRPV
jgi:hypothetical protein